MRARRRARPLPHRRTGRSQDPLAGPGHTGVVGAQGFAYKNYGALDVATAFMGHLVFGAGTGIFYGLLHSSGGSAAAF